MRKAARSSCGAAARSRRSTRIPAGWSTTPQRHPVFPAGSPHRASWFRTASRQADIDSIGITNQRETTVVWDRETGEPDLQRHRVAVPPHAPIIWTSSPADRRRRAPSREKTGLVPDAYFSASKIKWILDNVPGAREAGRARRSSAFGTVDSWLIWTPHRRAGARHRRNQRQPHHALQHQRAWAGTTGCLTCFGIPASTAARGAALRRCLSAIPTRASRDVQDCPSAAMAGDQQAALFGQCCFDAGRGRRTPTAPAAFCS